MKYFITLFLLLSTAHIITPSEYSRTPSQLSPIDRHNESAELLTPVGTILIGEDDASEDDDDAYATQLPTVRTIQAEDGTILYSQDDFMHLNLCRALNQASLDLQEQKKLMKNLSHSGSLKERSKENNIARIRHASNMILIAQEQLVHLINNSYFLQSPYILSRIRTMILVLFETINNTHKIKWNTIKHTIDNDEVLDAPLTVVEHGVMGGRKIRKHNVINNFIFYNTLIGEDKSVIYNQPLQVLDSFIAFFKFYKYTIARNVLKPYISENSETDTTSSFDPDSSETNSSDTNSSEGGESRGSKSRINESQ